MVNYLKLGYNSKLEYEKVFNETLLESNRTHEFYVDWNKIFRVCPINGFWILNNKKGAVIFRCGM